MSDAILAPIAPLRVRTDVLADLLEALHGGDGDHEMAAHDDALTTCELLGIADLADVQPLDDAVGLDRELSRILPRINALLAAPSSARDAEIARRMARHGERVRFVTDPVTAGWLRASGTSIGDLMLLARSTPDLRPVALFETDQTTSGYHERDALVTLTPSRDEGTTHVTVNIPLGGELSWQCGMLWGADCASETIRQAAAGRPLREVVGHPLLDEHDLIVAEWIGAGLVVESTWVEILAHRDGAN